MPSGDADSTLRRFWRFPFIAGWLAAILMLKFRMDQIEANAAFSPDPRTGRVVRLTQQQIYYITDSEHSSLVWFGIGIAAFVVCHFASAFITAGIRAPWRLIPIDDNDVSDEASWSAQITASIGAVVCAACIAVSYAIHWLE